MNLDTITSISNKILGSKKPSFKRHIYDKLSRDSKLIGIVGARGAGKTTLMQQFAKAQGLKTEEILYISVDHPICADFSLYDIADEFAKNGGKLLLIDEIHKRKAFDSELKMTYDVLNIRVIFSGSSALQILNADISRRATIYRLPTLSFREYLSLELKKPLQSYTLEEVVSNHIDIASEIIDDTPVIKHFKEYLQNGAYPFFIESKSDFLIKLEEILVKVIDEDLPAIYGTNYEMLVKVKMLLKMICKGSPKEINITKLSKDSGIYREKMYEILYQIREASLIRTIGSDASGGKLLNKPHKLYLDNTSLFWALCSEHDIGNVRETFVASMIEGAKMSVEYPKKGDFLVDGKYFFEVGGQGKEFGQISKDEGYILQDGIEIGVGKKIPLWLIGFLY